MIINATLSGSLGKMVYVGPHRRAGPGRLTMWTLPWLFSIRLSYWIYSQYGVCMDANDSCYHRYSYYHSIINNFPYRNLLGSQKVSTPYDQLKRFCDNKR